MFVTPEAVSSPPGKLSILLFIRSPRTGYDCLEQIIHGLASRPCHVLWYDVLGWRVSMVETLRSTARLCKNVSNTYIATSPRMAAPTSGGLALPCMQSWTPRHRPPNRCLDSLVLLVTECAELCRSETSHVPQHMLLFQQAAS